MFIVVILGLASLTGSDEVSADAGTGGIIITTTQVTNTTWRIEMNARGVVGTMEDHLNLLNDNVSEFMQAHDVVNLVPFNGPGGNIDRAGVTFGYWVFVNATTPSTTSQTH